MCVIVYRPKLAKVSDDTLSDCWDKNPDGAGLMCAWGGRLHVYRGIMSLDALLQLDRSLPPNIPKVYHFRIGTSGGAGPNMTHPFVIRRDLAFCHNGVLSGLGTNKASDTSVLRGWLRQCNIHLNNPGMVSLLDHYAKSGRSKFVFLDSFGRVAISNESAGSWEDGAWYSNTLFRPKRITYSDYSQDRSQATYIRHRDPVDTGPEIETTRPICDICNTVTHMPHYIDGTRLCYQCDRDFRDWQSFFPDATIDDFILSF